MLHKITWSTVNVKQMALSPMREEISKYNGLLKLHSPATDILLL